MTVLALALWLLGMVPAVALVQVYFRPTRWRYGHVVYIAFWPLLAVLLLAVDLGNIAWDLVYHRKGSKG